MSKLLCECGHVISDTTDDLPYKGELVADGDHELVWSVLPDLQGTTDRRWDAVTAIRMAHCRDLYECTSCGRLWIERLPGTRIFVSYSSDSGRVENILGPTGGRAT